MESGHTGRTGRDHPGRGRPLTQEADMNIRIRQFRLPALAAAATLALVGCSGTGDDGSPSETTAQTQSESPTGEASESTTQPGDDQSPTDTGTGEADDSGGSTAEDVDLADTDFAVSAEDALDISADEVAADGIVHSIELDYSSRHGAWIWNIDTLVGDTDHEVEINADTGDVVDHEQETTDDKEQPIDLTDPMTFDEALDLARAKADGPLREWKLEWDDGRREYQFDLGDLADPQEVTVDVETGKVYLDN